MALLLQLKLNSLFFVVFFLLANCLAFDETSQYKNITSTARDQRSSASNSITNLNDNLEPVNYYDIATGDLDPLTNASVPASIVSICEAFATVFAQAASDYTKCFLVNARPLHLCLKCVTEYLVLNRAYTDLEQVGFS